MRRDFTYGFMLTVYWEFCDLFHGPWDVTESKGAGKG